jgi:hypothetical protein
VGLATIQLAIAIATGIAGVAGSVAARASLKGVRQVQVTQEVEMRNGRIACLGR